MPQYSIIQAFFLSFFSPKLYRDVATQWSGKSFLYLLTLVTVASLVYATVLQIGLVQGYPVISANYVQQIPILTYTDGKLTTPENRPYEIVDPKTHEVIAIIDASGQYTSLDQTSAAVLVTQSDIITRSGKNDSRVNHISDKLNLTVDPVALDKVASSYLWTLWFLVFPFCVITLFIYRVVQSFIYAIIGKCFSLVCLVNLTYWQIVQLAMVSITPAIMLHLVVMFTPWYVPTSAYFLLAMVYLFYAILVNKKTA